MSRFPPLPPTSLDPSRLKLHDYLTDIALQYFGENGKVFTYADPATSALLGPFPLYIHTHTAHPVLSLLSALQTFSNTTPLTPSTRELVILATGAHFGAQYQLYSHARRAAPHLTPFQITELAQGRKPDGLDAQGSTAWDVVQELLVRRGPLGEEVWERAVRECGGRDAVMSVVQWCGVYSYVSVILNGCDVPVPEGESVLG